MTRYQQAAFASCLLAGIASCCAVSYLFGLHAGRDAAILAVSVRVDTLTIRDTIREKYPVPVTRWRTRTELMPVRDTVRIRDTVFIALDREAKEYRGEDYRAVVSGIRPALDCIEVFPKTVYLQTTVETQAPAARPRHFGFGITAGPGALWDGSAIRGGLGIVAGVSYNF